MLCAGHGGGKLSQSTPLVPTGMTAAPLDAAPPSPLSSATLPFPQPGQLRGISLSLPPLANAFLSHVTCYNEAAGPLPTFPSSFLPHLFFSFLPSRLCFPLVSPPLGFGLPLVLQPLQRYKTRAPPTLGPSTLDTPDTFAPLLLAHRHGPLGGAATTHPNIAAHIAAPPSAIGHLQPAQSPAYESLSSVWCHSLCWYGTAYDASLGSICNSTC